MSSVSIHPSSDIKTSKIGSGTTIWQFVVILSGAVIGEDCNINCNVFIENDVEIGNRVTIKSGVQLWDGIKVKDDVFIGPNATFVNNFYPRSKEYPSIHKGADIGRGASVGANATILANIIIGEYAMIGAGSVLTKNAPPFTVWQGNPAIHTGFITKKGIILTKKLQSKNGDKYEFIEDDFILVR